MKVEIWVDRQGIVLEDVPVDGPCCTWKDEEIRKNVLQNMDDATDLLDTPAEELRDEIDRAINQEKTWHFHQ